MNHHVLVVDDEPNVLRAVERLLRRDGYNVHTVENGPAALAILADVDVAVLVCDQRMPEMSGAEVLAQARQVRPETIRIALTGHTDLATALTSINEGRVSHLLLKPWDDEHLRTVVREAANSFTLRRENQRLLELTQQQKAELEEWNQKLERQVTERTAELDARNAELHALHDSQEQALRDTVMLLARLLEANSPNAGLHAKRVAELAVRVGEDLGLDAGSLRDLEFAARLHDIGKAARRHQSETRGSRSASQRAAAHGYAETGYRILSRVSGFEQVAFAVRHQGEHYDGSGHPSQLKAGSIPLSARILAMVNVYDEAVYGSNRTARYSSERGRQALRADRGRQLDPQLVKRFLDHVTRRNTTADDTETELSPRDVVAGMVLSRDLRNTEGLLVLRAKTTLTGEHIERIRRISDADPLMDGIFVRCLDDGPPAKAESEAPPAEASARVVKRAPAPTQRRALVVDDDPLVRSALTRELRRAGWETRTAEDGRSAQNLLEDETFDVLLVDVAMPYMTGDALVAHVQTCWPGQPCIILTGHATRNQISRLVEAPNVVEILAKPWEHERLLAALETALARDPALTAKEQT